jgi:hypothetical protein
MGRPGQHGDPVYHLTIDGRSATGKVEADYK